MSEHLFAWRTTTTARLTDDAEAMANDLDPVLCTVGPATAQRRPHAIQLLGRLFPTDLPSPAGPTFRLSATELLPFRERVQDGIGMAGAMAAVARPGILARVAHHRGPHRVGLDVPQNDEQVVAVLDDRRSEAALPDVAAGSQSPVVPPGVSDGQGLEDAADRLPGGRLEKQMKMLGHQAVAEERERVPCLGAGKIAKEHIPFAVGAEDIGSVVPAVDRVVNNQPRPEAVVLGRPPEGADYVRLPPLGAWSWSGPSFLPGTGRGFSVDDDFQAYPLSCESLPKP